LTAGIQQITVMFLDHSVVRRSVFAAHVSEDSAVRTNTQGDSGVISSHPNTISAVFPPWCGASSAKRLLLWHHFLSKIVIIRTFS